MFVTHLTSFIEAVSWPMLHWLIYLAMRLNWTLELNTRHLAGLQASLAWGWMSEFNRALPKRKVKRENWKVKGKTKQLKGKLKRGKLCVGKHCSQNLCNTHFSSSLHFCILVGDHWGWSTKPCVFSKHWRPERQMVLVVSGLQGWLLSDETGGCSCARQL